MWIVVHVDLKAVDSSFLAFVLGSYWKIWFKIWKSLGEVGNSNSKMSVDSKRLPKIFILTSWHEPMISAWPGAIWKGQTLPTIGVAFWKQYISLRGPGGAAEGVLVRVSGSRSSVWLGPTSLLKKHHDFISSVSLFRAVLLNTMLTFTAWVSYVTIVLSGFCKMWWVITFWL